jgi:hypothetical protein
MADFWSNLGTTLFGDQGKKDQLQNNINSIQDQINQGIGYIPALQNQLAELKQQLASEMQAQGATDANGRLLSAKDTQNQFIDQNYLNLRNQQNQDIMNTQLAQSIQQGKRAQLQGSTYNPSMMAGSLEGTQRNNANSLAGDIKNESELAYNKSGEDLARRQAYATQLSNTQRQSILDQMQTQMASIGLNQQQMASYTQQLQNMPDGLLNQLAQVGVKAGVGYLMSGGNPLGAIAGAASGLGNQSTSQQSNYGNMGASANYAQYDNNPVSQEQAMRNARGY